MARHFGFDPYIGRDNFVFMTYLPTDALAAQEFARYLNDDGINVHYDAYGIDMAQLFDVIRMEKCSGLIIFASAETFKTQFILDQVQKASYARKPILSIYYKEDVTQIDIMTKVLLASSKKYEAWKEDIEKARDAVLDYAYQMIYGSDYLDSSSLDGDNIIQSDDCVWEILSDSEVELKRYINKEENFTVPAEVGNRFVKRIGDTAFMGCIHLISAVIPDGVEAIGENSFKGCRHLESIEISDSVKTIGENAFSDCRDLTTLTIPSCIVETPNLFGLMFRDCVKTTYVTVADGAEIIGKDAFYGLGKLASVKLPETVKEIGESAFGNCHRMTSVNIPSKVESIGNEAFYGCPRINILTLPKTVTHIGDWAFRDCRGLISITIPGDITDIGDSILADCPYVTIRSSGGKFSPIRKYADKNYLRYKKVK